MTTMMRMHDNDNVPTVEAIDALLECLDIARARIPVVRARPGAVEAVMAIEVRRQLERQMGLAS